MKVIKDNEIHFRITTVDKNEINRLAEMAGLTPAEYVRSAALNIEINSRFDLLLAVRLFKVSADLARLGNLLKLALDRFYECDNKKVIKEITDLLHEVKTTQTKLKVKVNNL